MRRLMLAAGAAILALACRAAIAAPADDMRVLLEQGRAAEAYALGRKHPEELGKPEFDFYFGVAAVDTGHAGEGVLALERYIIRFPDNDRARLELARGYFVLGEMVRAREEFDAVARKNPPPGVQATIDRFMDQIQSQETRYSTTATGYVEIGGGYDSNVNSGVGNPLINVPTLGTVQLAQAGVKSGSSFMHLGAGGNFSYPIAPGMALVGGASYEGKLHENGFDQQFDQYALNAQGGVSYIKDKDLWRAQLHLSTLYVDYNRFRDFMSLAGEWHRQLDEFNRIWVSGTYGRLQYPASPVRDADLYGGSVGWRRAFVGAMQPVFELAAGYAEERNDFSPVRNDLSRDIYIARGSLALTPAAQWGLSVGATYTKSRFKAADPLFAATRDDDYWGLELGVSYRLTRKVTLRGDYQRSDNQSNISLYQYRRDIFTVRARYEF